MTRKTSAGILLYRRGSEGLELLLAHPGGPFFARRDLGHWTIPKGEPGDEDDLMAAASREFEEETGHPLGEVARQAPLRPIDLGSVVQASGKRVFAWAVEGDLDPDQATSNTFELEWPPGSGQVQEFPEIDAVAWYPVAEAQRRINRAQAAFVQRLAATLGADGTATRDGAGPIRPNVTRDAGAIPPDATRT
jgi:predicted NUDIX family NTP pyrophosphohydrolase